MTEETPQAPLPIVPLAIAGAVVLVGCLLIGGVIFTAVSGFNAGGKQVAQNTPLATARPVVIYTPTPAPTHTPTVTPTPIPSETPTPTVLPTKTFVPSTRVPPTAVPPTAGPTDIPATAVPLGRGWITDIQFNVPQTSVPTNAHIVFSFHIFNARGLDWDFGCIGVKVTDINGVFIKNQWSLGNSSLVHMSYNSALDWSDSVKNISAQGTFLFSLWIRYDQQLCGASGGDWENLTPGGVKVIVY